MSEFFEFNGPDKVVVATIGPVGQRTFFLEAAQGDARMVVKLEKQQVGALAKRLGELLQDLPRPGELPDHATGIDEVDEPDFVVGTIALAYDATDDRIVILVEELTNEDEDGAEARLALTREQAGALAIEGTRLVEAGRPPCPLCGYPLDPRGHACPRTNGHHPPIT